MADRHNVQQIGQKSKTNLYFSTHIRHVQKIFFEYKQAFKPKVVLTLVEIPLPIVGQVIKIQTFYTY